MENRVQALDLVHLHHVIQPSYIKGIMSGYNNFKIFFFLVLKSDAPLLPVKNCEKSEILPTRNLIS